MKDAYKPLWVILFVIAGLLAMVGIARMRGAATAGDGQDHIPWKTDLTAAREQSAKERKPILLYFTAPWCGPCQEMKRTTWADPRVAAAAGAMIPVKIDVDEQKAVSREFGVQGIPRVEWVEPDGSHHLVFEGLVTPDEFLSRIPATPPK
jgi:thiol:disulfide interchange protein